MFENGLAYFRRGFSAGENWGTVLDWGFLITVLISVLILVGILVPLIVNRGRRPTVAVWVVYLLALGVLPLFLWPIGTFAVFEYSEKVHFCGSCHAAMQPYVDDLTDPHRRTLAALHYQNRISPGSECFSCHANYGAHGLMSAKLEGLSDAYRYITRSYPVPIKLSEPFPNALCLKCHDNAKIFMSVQYHLGADGKLSKAIADGSVRCEGCHGAGHQVAAG